MPQLRMYFIHNLFVARVGGVMIVSAIAARKNCKKKTRWCDNCLRALLLLVAGSLTQLQSGGEGDRMREEMRDKHCDFIWKLFHLNARKILLAMVCNK